MARAEAALSGMPIGGRRGRGSKIEPFGVKACEVAETWCDLVDLLMK